MNLSDISFKKICYESLPYFQSADICNQINQIAVIYYKIEFYNNFH